LQVNELDTDLLQGTRVFHFGSLSLTDEPARSATHEAVRIARQAGALISYDINYRPSLWKEPHQALEQALQMLPMVDLLKVNEVEVALLSESGPIDPADTHSLAQASRRLLDKGPSLVVVTLGRDGSYFQIDSGGEFIPAFRVETIDAIGCGDAFVAGLLTRLVQEGDWRDKMNVDQLRVVLKFANAVGALTSKKRGVIPALPTLQEVEHFLEVNG
jgi:fructokinase